MMTKSIDFYTTENPDTVAVADAISRYTGYLGSPHDTGYGESNLKHSKTLVRNLVTDQDERLYPGGSIIGIGSPTTLRIKTTQDDVIDKGRTLSVFLSYSPTDTTHTRNFVEEPQELKDAIQELNELNEEAIEYDIQMPPSEVSDTVERLLKSMYNVLPIRPVVELLSDSSIAIRMIGPKGNSVTTIVEANGETIVIVRLDGKTDRRAWYTEATSLIDGFIEDALNSLRKAIPSAAK